MSMASGHVHDTSPHAKQWEYNGAFPALTGSTATPVFIVYYDEFTR